MASQDPTKPRPEENAIPTGDTKQVRTDITGESHVQSEPLTDAQSVRTYIVREGDTFESIAEMFYGNRNGWLRIRDANRDRLAETDRLQPGGEIRVPID